MLNVVGFYGKKCSSLWREACQCEKKQMEKLCCLFFMHVEPGGPKGVSAILDRKTRFMPALRRFRGQMSRSFPPIAERLQATAATVSASRLARCCCEMSASASRRDNTDRSLARSAWESVPRKNRPVGYGMIGRS
jgi:hypothetical protein